MLSWIWFLIIGLIAGLIARLLMPGKDAMVRWEGTFMLGRDDVKLIVRATDGSGEIQTDEFRLPQPDGASGRDTITVGAA